MVWTHLVRHEAATHGPLWWSTTNFAHNLDRGGTVEYIGITQVAGWRNEVYFSSGSWVPTSAHGGTVVDDNGDLWILGNVGSDNGGKIGRWNPTTHQIAPIFNTDPLHIGGALDLWPDGSGGLWVVSGPGVLSHWTGGATAPTAYSSITGTTTGYNPYNMKTVTPLIDGFGRYYFSGDAYLPSYMEQWVGLGPGSGHSFSRNWWFGMPSAFFPHNGTMWVLAQGLWRWDIGSYQSWPCDALWKLISGDPTDPANYLCQAKFASTDLNSARPALAVDFLSGFPSGSTIVHFGGGTYFISGYIGASASSSAIYVLPSGSDTALVSKGEIVGEKLGGIADLDGELYSVGMASTTLIRIYQLVSGTWTLVASHTFSVALFFTAPAMCQGVNHELWIWPLQSFAGPSYVLSWDGLSFTEHPNTVFSQAGGQYSRLWYSPY